MEEYETGRKCEQCGTALNIYNEGPNCHAHSNESFRIRYVPVTCCTSYKPQPFHKEPNLEGLLSEPGTESYTEMAFNSEIEVAEYVPETNLWVYCNGPRD
jgi:hypothetical protein